MFTENANTAFINALFSAQTIAGMAKGRPVKAKDHASWTRLLQVVPRNELVNRLDLGPQQCNAWRVRGVSKEGALRIEGAFGYSAVWILSGEGAQMALTPKPGTDWTNLRHSEYDTLAALRMLSEEQREKFTAELLDAAHAKVSEEHDILERLRKRKAKP
jgi:hypothetical protein